MQRYGKSLGKFERKRPEILQNISEDNIKMNLTCIYFWGRMYELDWSDSCHGLLADCYSNANITSCPVNIREFL